METQSLRETGRVYTLLQGRIKDGGVLHVQGEGVPVNRNYGVAVDILLPDKLAAWLGEQPATKVSLADSDALYVPMQGRVMDGKAHIQVLGPSLNRNYGASFDVEGTAGVKLVRFLGGDDTDNDEATGVATLA